LINKQGAKAAKEDTQEPANVISLNFVQDEMEDDCEACKL
jgi:hypothetical protein